MDLNHSPICPPHLCWPKKCAAINQFYLIVRHVQTKYSVSEIKIEIEIMENFIRHERLRVRNETLLFQCLLWLRIHSVLGLSCRSNFRLSFSLQVHLKWFEWFNFCVTQRTYFDNDQTPQHDYFIRIFSTCSSNRQHFRYRQQFCVSNPPNL